MIVADVYPAGEQPIEGASRDALIEGLRRYGHRRVLPLDGAAAYEDASRAESTPVVVSVDVDAEAPPEATGDTTPAR